MKNMNKKVVKGISKVLVSIGDKEVDKCSIVGVFYEPKISDKLLKK